MYQVTDCVRFKAELRCLAYTSGFLTYSAKPVFLKFFIGFLQAEEEAPSEGPGAIKVFSTQHFLHLRFPEGI